MADTDPAHWLAVLEVIGLGVGGIISSTLPTWLMNRHEERKEEVEGKSKPAASAPALADEVLDDLLAQVTQLRRSAASHFGEAALADSVVVKFGQTVFDSVERIKEAIRAVHRDVRQCAKDLDK